MFGTWPRWSVLATYLTGSLCDCPAERYSASRSLALCRFDLRSSVSTSRSAHWMMSLVMSSSNCSSGFKRKQRSRPCTLLIAARKQRCWPTIGWSLQTTKSVSTRVTRLLLRWIRRRKQGRHIPVTSTYRASTGFVPLVDNDHQNVLRVYLTSTIWTAFATV